MTTPGGGAPPPAPETRDWAALPGDILSDVFLRLGPGEVMLGAEFACTAWRRVALDEPALWRCVGMDEWNARCRYVNEYEMSLAAVDRSAGQCEAFMGSFCGEDLLDLTQRAPSLKTLHINHYTRIYENSIEESTEALKKFPLLEDLEIEITDRIIDEDNILAYVCHACPRLKKLVVTYPPDFDLDGNKGGFYKKQIDGGIPMMSELHSLKLHDCDLSIEGLHDILDNCPLLESLYVDGYFNKRGMDKDLQLKCARVKNLTLPSSAARPYDYCSSEYYSDSSEDYDDDNAEGESE